MDLFEILPFVRLTQTKALNATTSKITRDLTTTVNCCYFKEQQIHQVQHNTQFGNYHDAFKELGKFEIMEHQTTAESTMTRK